MNTEDFDFTRHRRGSLKNSQIYSSCVHLTNLSCSSERNKHRLMFAIMDQKIVPTQFTLRIHKLFVTSSRHRT